jgi:hypothetical protein
MLVWALRRANWRPTAPLRLAHRRAWGQILSAAARMYVSHLRLFVGIGLLLVPISLLITLFQALLLTATSVLGIDDQAAGAGLLVLIALIVGSTMTWLGLGLVQAVAVRAMVEIDQGRELGPLAAFRLAATHGRVLWAILLAVAVETLLTSSVLLIPVAIWVAVRWALAVQVVVIEGGPVRKAFRRSGLLVRGHWLKVASLTVALGLIAVVLGPAVGTALILATDLPLWLLNVVAGLVYVLTMPFVALATSYVYFDTRVSDGLREDRAEIDRLPAEIDLGPA